MIRKLFHAYCLFSCFLLALSVVAWVRSYSHDEGAISKGANSTKIIGYSEGSYYWLVEHKKPDVDDSGPWERYSYPPGRPHFVTPPNADLALSSGGIEFVLVAGQTRWVVLPMWFVTMVSTIRPGFWLRYLWVHRRAKKRRALGQCEKCAHDLGGETVEKCPKCGAKEGKIR